MLSQLDHIIFPDRCEVYEVVPSQRYVYAIYKNGSSSLMMCGRDHGWRVLINEQISKLDSIDVILRDPEVRLLSGINIYLQQIQQQNPLIDRATAIWFVKNYLFLNRHFCPQFHWILNLARYLKAGTQLNICTMSSLDDIVDRNFKPTGYAEVSEDLGTELGDINDFEMYRRLDQAMIDSCMGRSVTFDQLIQSTRSQDPVAYAHVVGRCTKVLEPLRVLSQT